MIQYATQKKWLYILEEFYHVQQKTESGCRTLATLVAPIAVRTWSEWFWAQRRKGPAADPILPGSGGRWNILFFLKHIEDDDENTIVETDFIVENMIDWQILCIKNQGQIENECFFHLGCFMLLFLIITWYKPDMIHGTRSFKPVTSRRPEQCTMPGARGCAWVRVGSTRRYWCRQLSWCLLFYFFFLVPVCILIFPFVVGKFLVGPRRTSLIERGALDFFFGNVL